MSLYLRVADLDAVAVTKTVGITVIAQRREEKSSAASKVQHMPKHLYVHAVQSVGVQRVGGGGGAIEYRQTCEKDTIGLKKLYYIFPFWGIISFFFF